MSGDPQAVAAKRLHELADILAEFQLERHDESSLAANVEDDDVQRARLKHADELLHLAGRMRQSASTGHARRDYDETTASRQRRVAAHLQNLADQVRTGAVELTEREPRRPQRPVAKPTMTTTYRQAYPRRSRRHDAAAAGASGSREKRSDATADTYASRSKRISSTDLYSRALQRATTPAHEQVFPLPSLKIAARLGVVT